MVYDAAMSKSKQTAKKKSPLKPNKKRRLAIKNKWLLAYGGILVATALVAAIAAQSHRQPISADPFTSEQRSAVGFTLYYPTNLPGTLHVESSSLGQVQSNIVNMRIVGRGSNDKAAPAATPGSNDSLNISVSQQPVPAGFDMATFLKSFAGSKQVKTKYGVATYGIIGNADGSQSYLASLVASDNTWILIQAPSNTSTKDLETIIKGLAASKN